MFMSSRNFLTQSGASFVDLFVIKLCLFVICVLCLYLSYCLVCFLQPCAGKGLTPWLSCV